MREVEHCRGCGEQLPLIALACPHCRRLVHTERLRDLIDAAGRAEGHGDVAGAVAAWREALALVPPQSKQSGQIAGRLERLGASVGAGPASVGKPSPAPSWPPWGHAAGTAGAAGAAGLTGLALLLFKFKFVILFALTKAKFLLIGLTKAKTFLSMFLMIGVYAVAYGWPFAVGIVLSIYVHEMGHVYALARYGIRASAPLFIPFVGAVIRLQQAFHDPREDARVGLAGPLWGLGAAGFCYLIHLATGVPVFAALARIGAYINLFNLMPIWQLDGARAFHSLDRTQRWLAVGSIAVAWTCIGSAAAPDGEGAGGLLFLIGLVAIYQAWAGTPARRPDGPALTLYVALVFILSAMSLIPIPGRLR